MTIKKIYLAGPDVFHLNPLLRSSVLKKICARYDFEGIFPSDNSINKELDKNSLSKKIFNENEKLILSCDAVLANMMPFRGPSMDVGTAYELGFARGHGKIVVGYTSDLREYKEKVEEFDSIILKGKGTKNYGDDWTVEDFGLIDNLMLVYSTYSISENIEDALYLLQKHFFALEALTT